MGTRNRKKGRKKNQKLKQVQTTQINVSSHAEDLSSAGATPKHLQQMEPPWQNLYKLIRDLTYIRRTFGT
jgi:hypothetical protein